MIKSISENERALWILKNQGAKSLKEMSKELEVTTEGARFHLLKLSNEGFVKSESLSVGRGRPKQIWSLTDKGQSKFPDEHASLTVKLINTIKEDLGEAALEKIITSTGESNRKRYMQHLENEDRLEKRIELLANLRTQEGYMADYIKHDDGFLFFENHCPICAAATVCQGFCRAELQTFKEVLGQNVEIRRVEHILEGARRCAYSINPV